MKVRGKFKTALVLSALFLGAVDAHAQVFAELGDLTEQQEEGKRICEGDTDDDPGNDVRKHCKMYEQKITGGEAQNIAMGTYAAASTVCLVECGITLAGSGATDSMACTLSGGAAAAGEVVTSFAMGAETADIVKNLVAGGGGSGLNFAMQFLDGDNDADKMNKADEQISLLSAKEHEGNITPDELKKLEEAKAAKTAAQDAKKKHDRKVACMGAAVNAGQSALRRFNAEKSFDSAKQDLQTVFEIYNKAHPMGKISQLATGDGAKNKAGGSAGATQGAPGIRQEADRGAAKTGEQMAESAAKAGQGPLLRHFENLTGKPSSELFNRMKAGQHPVLAGAEMASGKLGAEGMAMASQLPGVGTQIASKFSDKLNAAEAKSGVSKFAYDNSMSGYRSKSGGGGGGMDFGSLMSSLLPKKVDKAALEKTALATRKPATKDGLHAPERSLFEVVNARYVAVGTKFLAGENVVKDAKAPSLLPANPYLRK